MGHREGFALAAFSVSLFLAPSQEPFSRRPTQPEFLNTRPGVKYVGDETCQGCHPSVFQTFKQTGMGRSASLPSTSDAPVKVPGKQPGREYSSFAKDGKIFHTITQRNAEGQEAFFEVHQVKYVIGSGDHARGYLIARGDALFMSPISYYSDVHKWDLSPGYAAGAFRDFARPVAPFCAYCHMGMHRHLAGTINRYQDPPFRSLTIGCESCHGPGEIHVNQRLRGAPSDGAPGHAIVNPAKLAPVQRDDVCYQCHFPGDIRIYRPGKTDLDFRPGTLLDDVVTVFTLPPSVKPGGLQVVGQAIQLKMSRCWKTSNGKMGCITCHDPHVQKRGAEAAMAFRTRCLSCHAGRGCGLPAAQRRKTSPADNCISCHMPRAPLSTIPHTSHTNHQIPRTPEQGMEMLFGASDSFAPPELVCETRVPGRPDQDLRTRALAHVEAARGLPTFTAKAMRLIDQAAQAFQDDAEVQEAFGRMLRIAQPARTPEAEKALERAITFGATSIAARTELAELRLKRKDVEGAIALYLEAIRREPYVASSYLSLARIYARQGDRKSAQALVEKVRSFDPGNPELHGDWFR